MKVRLIAALALMGLASGCTSINSSSFAEMSSAYREIIESYTNDNILLNVVRSSKNMPMSFLDIPSVIGTGNVTASAGASTTQSAGTPVTPPAITTGNLGLAVNNGFTFTQASLDNAQFMQSFLKEIPLSVLGSKGTKRLLPRAVSYTLLIESVELRRKNSVIHRFNNDPLDPNYQAFQDMLYLLIESGLTLENTTTQVPLGPPLEKSALNGSFQAWGSTLMDKLADGSLSLNKITHSGLEMYQLVRNEQHPRVCVNKYRAQELLGSLLSEKAYCQDSPRYAKTDASYYARAMAAFEKAFPREADLELAISIRSPGNVFDFLGAVLNAQFMDNGARTVMIQPSQSVFDYYNPRYKNPEPLFKVYRNDPDIRPAASVQYQGVTYAISDNDGSYTKDVMEFMSSLVTIAKIPGAIPASPAVVVR